MNIKSIKNELLVKSSEVEMDTKFVIGDVVDIVMDTLSDMIFEEGKIADIMIEHGKARSKKYKRSCACLYPKRKK